MSWHNPERSSEPQAETALREELRGLLGMPARPSNYFETEATPQLIALADKLRQEARRRHYTARKRNSWMLLAAAVPFALALGGVGAWGIGEKRKIDQLSATMADQRAEIQRLATALQPASVVPADHAPTPKQPAAVNSAPLLVGGTPRGGKPRELVIPVERPVEAGPGATQRVKNR